MRIKWIDQYKGFLGLLVVIGHAIEWSQLSNNIQFFELLFFIIYTFHMPAFFVLSGFVGAKKTYKCINGEATVAIFKRVLNLAVPTAFFTVIHIGTLMLFTSIASFEAIIETIRNYWFMYVMLLLSVCYPILKISLKNDWKIIVLTLLMATCFGRYSNTLAKLFAYFLSYAVGSFLSKDIFTESKLKQIIRNKNINIILTIGVLCFLLVMLLMYKMYGADLALNVYYKNFFGLVVSITLIPIFYKMRTFNLLVTLGKYTLQMYLIHIVLFVLAKHYIFDVSLWTSVALFLVLTAAGVLVPIIFCKKFEGTKLYNIIFKPYQYVEKYLPSMRIKA